MDNVVFDAPGLHGVALLNDPTRSKGTAFTVDGRRSHGLEGLLPHAVETLDRQFKRAMGQLDKQPDDLARCNCLTALQDRSETLFFRVVMSDPKRFLPIVYDPTVADACVQYGHIYRRARGTYISLDMRGRVAEVLRNWPTRDVRFICARSGERILGLGDIGVNGAPLLVGKLQLYPDCTAVPPGGMLPVLVDIGTTNAPCRADGLYLGLRQLPPSDELDSFMDEEAGPCCRASRRAADAWRCAIRDRPAATRSTNAPLTRTTTGARVAKKCGRSGWMPRLRTCCWVPSPPTRSPWPSPLSGSLRSRRGCGNGSGRSSASVPAMRLNGRGSKPLHRRDRAREDARPRGMGGAAPPGLIHQGAHAHPPGRVPEPVRGERARTASTFTGPRMRPTTTASCWAGPPTMITKGRQPRRNHPHNHP